MDVQGVLKSGRTTARSRSLLVPPDYTDAMTSKTVFALGTGNPQAQIQEWSGQEITEETP